MYRRIKPAAASTTTNAVAVLLTAKTKTPPAGLPDPDAVKALLGRSSASLEAGKVHVLHHGKPGGKGKPAMTLVVGLGDSAKLDADTLRLAGAAALRALDGEKAASVRVVSDKLPAKLAGETLGNALADGMSLANFTFDAYHGKAKRPDKAPKQSDLSVQLPAAEMRGFKRGLSVAEGAATARTLACTPPNVANPKYIANYCKNLAKKSGLKCSVIDVAKAKQHQMGGLLAVGAGGSTPPCMVVLEWSPTGTAKDKPVLLVGKGVTFDTGGYSLKPDGGKGMKYDKCGGMNVIGAMQSIANLKLKRRVVGIVGLAENMVDTNAYRVDDIITLCNGVTCEVTNTDAEGRLVLADCLAYGTKTYKPSAVVDYATLTGGVVVALGKKIAGVWCTDDKLMKSLEKAGETAGEPVWQLPLDDDYRKMMQAKHADLHNSAPVREAHPIQGAAFLSYFVGDDAPKQLPTTPWAHVDIAGTSNTDGGTLMEKGPTGFGVRLTVELIASM
ncbi:leucyl aminopeptidase family protein [Phycisphaeraceae bacterium D3-23]